jgi:hypothetical protein
MHQFQEYGHFQYYPEIEDDLANIRAYLAQADIHTLGRYANWNHEEKIDSTLKNILKLRSELK